MTELNREQSEKADYLLEIVCNSETTIDSKIAYDLFENREEALYVCSILQKLNLIEAISPTENDPFYYIGWTTNTCQYLKNGGFTKKFEQSSIIKKTDTKSLNDKFEKLFDKLNELGVGQEVVFNELEELRALYSKLDKKNWKQLVKGKIIDLGLSKVINEDIMKLIYDNITDEVLKLN